MCVFFLNSQETILSLLLRFRKELVCNRNNIRNMVCDKCSTYQTLSIGCSLFLIELFLYSLLFKRQNPTSVHAKVYPRTVSMGKVNRFIMAIDPQHRYSNEKV